MIHPVPKLLLLCAVLLSASCASEVGEREDLDSGDVDDQLGNIKFSVPDGFTFGQGYRTTEFVGQGPVYLRFDAVLAVVTDDGKRAHLFISSAGH